MRESSISIALVGLGFGGSFAPIYRDHPNVRAVGLCDQDSARAALFAKATGIQKLYADLDEILADPTVDAVHLVTPIPQHEEQTLRVLHSGKHCACTVPMATSLEGLQRIVDAVRQTGMRYMMMETSIYTYSFFTVRELLLSGTLGRIQFLRGSHYQDMHAWPEYWMGLPPMHYGTHALSPLRVLANSAAVKVACVGSGTMDQNMVGRYGNPFPVESALISFQNGMKAEATRTLSNVARPYLEGFSVYGSKASFEWGFEDASKPILSISRDRPQGQRGRDYDISTLEPRNPQELLPESIRRYTLGGKFDPTNPQNSLKEDARGGHHGSHPHMAHEFVRCILEDREPWLDLKTGANITAMGIQAHASAMMDGMPLEIPEF